MRESQCHERRRRLGVPLYFDEPKIDWLMSTAILVGIGGIVGNRHMIYRRGPSHFDDNGSAAAGHHADREMYAAESADLFLGATKCVAIILCRDNL